MTGTMNGTISSLAPPSDKPLRTEKKLLLFLQCLWLNILLLPMILWETLRIIFPPRMKSLHGQVVLVTGAGRGLGRGLALQFAQEGCKVAVADINRDNAEQTAADIVKAGGQAKAYVVNVAEVEEVRELQKAISRDLGSIDILVNNAGLIHAEPLEKFSDDAIRTLINVNLTSHFWMVREFLPTMKQRNSGHIVAVASLASFCSFRNASAYVAPKYGIRGFMEVVRSELNQNPDNQINTTTVFPYFINTSADYINSWDLRIAAISIEEAVEGVVTGVRRNQVTVFIPRYCRSLPLLSVLPQYIADSLLKIFYARARPLTVTEKERSLTTAITKGVATQ